MSFLKFKMLCASMVVLSCSSAFAGLVNINKADSETLAHNLKGIGEKKAEAIIEYRTTHGAFTDIEDLVNVKGIGEGILTKNLSDLSLSKGAVQMGNEVEETSGSKKKLAPVAKKPVVIEKSEPKKTVAEVSDVSKKLASTAVTEKPRKLSTKKTVVKDITKTEKTLK